MQVMRTNKLINRHNWNTDTFYEEPDGSVFVTPDGVGAFFYENMEEALKAHGPLPRHWILYREADLETHAEWIAENLGEYNEENEA